MYAGMAAPDASRDEPQTPQKEAASGMRRQLLE